MLDFFRCSSQRGSLAVLCTCDGLGAAAASLGEEFPEAFTAVGLLIFGGELLSGQLLVAVGAGEALAVPR